jgi:hypothetical protein
VRRCGITRSSGSRLGDKVVGKMLDAIPYRLSGVSPSNDRPQGNVGRPAIDESGMEGIGVRQGTVQFPVAAAP